MKKLFCFCLLATFFIAACNRQPDKKAEQSMTELRNYVDSLKSDHTYVNEDQWMGVETNYEEKKQQVEANASRLTDQQKTDYDNLKQEYAELKVKYDAERERVRAYNERRMMLRKALFGEGVIGEDMNFSFMNGKNAYKVYETFVNTVNEHRDEYSREDWDEIKVLYEAMDTRKNEIEKEISGADINKIALLKVKFVAIKAINRPFSKMEENSDAKDKDVQ